MDDACSRRYRRRAADARRPDAEIKILPVHEKLIIEAGQAFPYQAVNEQEASGYDTYLAFGVASPVTNVVSIESLAPRQDR